MGAGGGGGGGAAKVGNAQLPIPTFVSGAAGGAGFAGQVLIYY
jgi:hypothetical protein